MVAEVVGGILLGQSSPAGAAGHMLTDAAAIALALFAIWIGGRPASVERTFGCQSTEVLAAMLNPLSLWLIAGWVLFEAFRRLREPPEIEGGFLLIVFQMPGARRQKAILTWLGLIIAVKPQGIAALAFQLLSKWPFFFSDINPSSHASHSSRLASSSS